ncbi:MAG: hypothetical protein ACI8W8_003689 [Rhodothermales bacterium]|jgi:hypothetical protein
MHAEEETSIATTFSTSILSLILGATLVATQARGAVDFVVESDVKEPFSDEALSMQVSGRDLLSGRSFVSSLPLALGGPHGLTDGIGGEPVRRGNVHPENGSADWTITFSALEIRTLREVRVFSFNMDSRARQDYDIAVSHDGGKTFASLAKDIMVSPSKTLNLTRVNVDVKRVTDLRLTFRSSDKRRNPKGSGRSTPPVSWGWENDRYHR